MTTLGAAVRSAPRRVRHGLWVTFLPPFGLELAAEADIDWIGVDLQHGEIAVADLGPLARSTRIPLLARVPSHSAEIIGRVIDVGVDGVVVPAVDTPEQARDLVAASYLPPIGRRSTGLTRAGVVGVTGQPLLLAMVETADGLRNVHAIAETDGVDGVFVGPYDLARSLGCAIEDGELIEAVRRIIDVTREAGGITGVFAGNTMMRSALPDVDLLAVDSDAAALRIGLRQLFPRPETD